MKTKKYKKKLKIIWKISHNLHFLGGIKLYRDVMKNDRTIQRRASKYGISYEYCVELLKTTECAICGKKGLKGRNQHIDHNHTTGEVRGILCAPCNVKLGVIENNLHSLHVFARYAGYDLKKIIEDEEDFRSKNLLL